MNVTQSQGWLQWMNENKYEFAAASVIILALAMIMIGLASAAICHLTNQYQFVTSNTDQWEKVDDALRAAANTTALIAIPCLEVGGFALTAGILWKVYLYQHKKTEREGIEHTTTEEAQKAVREKRLKAVGLLLGFLVTMLGVGFIATTSIALHEISNVKSLMNEVPQYRPEMQAWIDSCEPGVNGLLATGVLVSIVGGGIFGGTLFFAQLKAAWNKHFRQISDESVAAKKHGDDDL